jgi:hypothetical protein
MTLADLIEPQWGNLLVRADPEAKPPSVIDLSVVKDKGRTDSGVILKAGPGCSEWVLPGVRIAFDSKAGRIVAPEGVVGKEPVVLMHQDAILGTIEEAAS